jgi:mannose-1-phosphate guanylyltransferase
MKAFLLAAGLGARLRPLTDTMPKPLVPIAGQPLLDRWLDNFHNEGVDEVLINLHHLPSVVEEHLRDRVGPPTVMTRYEPELLGSAGTLLANRDWVAGEDFFLACNADNLTDFKLGALIDAHRVGGHPATLAVFRADEPSRCGIVETDASGTMTAFVEKPAAPRSNLANAGMYAFDVRVLGSIGSVPPQDIGTHLLPRLVRRAGTVPVTGYFRDIGTMESYRLAQEEWQAR